MAGGGVSEYEYMVVDAFTHEPFTGNPAGVVLDADGLTDDHMRRIATEINLSETTFVLPRTSAQAAVRFRWFTPTVEVRMCGHATLAAVHALLESGRFTNQMREPGATLPIETAGGLLTMRTFQQDAPTKLTQYWLDLVPPTLRHRPANAKVLAEAMGIEMDNLVLTRPFELTQDDDLIVSVDTVNTLMTIQPDRSRLIAFCQKGAFGGVCVTTTTTISPAITAQSRFFAPAVGIDEDPVTGSVHGPLAVYLLKHGAVKPIQGQAYMECIQAKAGPGGRAGLVRMVTTEQDNGHHAVRIGGNCVTTMRGKIALPDPPVS